MLWIGFDHTSVWTVITSARNGGRALHPKGTEVSYFLLPRLQVADLLWVDLFEGLAANPSRYYRVGRLPNH